MVAQLLHTKTVTGSSPVSATKIKLEQGSVEKGSHEYFGQYIFRLRTKPKDKTSAFLVFYDTLPKSIYLRIEELNGLQSSIDFENITRVKYIPKFRAVILESHTKTHFSVLKIYWRGQFDLSSNNPQKYYKDSAWDKKKPNPGF